MATPKSLSKMRTASRMCKLSAWIIAATGAAMIIMYVSFILLPVVPYFRQAQYLTVYSYTSFTVTLSTLFLITVPTLFFAIILYALGTIIDYLMDQTKPDEVRPTFLEEDMDDIEEDDGRLEIVPIPEMR